ncbi:hypothetical protein PR048_019566 [Dryococelus australis]|uniref:Uncharacterized protein n=1 Tax=Dryococelus australis TaxID=614101 RepID=A0ABQ9H3W5_9NEOP|nr:hypothetical protein PR048_019566 [Dryococelus australis]
MLKDQMLHKFMNAFANVLEEYCGLGVGEIKDYLVGFASDGATLCTTKFKQLNPCMIDVLCLAHCLAVKDAVEKIPLCTELECFSKLLYSFFHHSQVHRSILKTACDNEGVNFCAPTRVGSTRWLSHTQRAVTGAVKLYPVLQKNTFEAGNENDKSSWRRIQ